MKIAIVAAGFTPSEADRLRRAAVGLQHDQLFDPLLVPEVVNDRDPELFGRLVSGMPV